jgi:hypothetical protein
MRHRGKHANDDIIFAPKWKPIFAAAAADLSYLLSRNYGIKSAVALVGNRYQLNKRQQRALSLITAPADRILSRKAKQYSITQIRGKNIQIDGYNLLISIEAALSGGYVFVSQDGCYRDIASVHGTYKRVEETQQAIELIHYGLQQLGVAHVQWYFDAPVSNSGRLKTFLYEYATSEQANWDIELVMNPDTTLVHNNELTISCDSWIIDEVDHYFDLAAYLIDSIEKANVLDFFVP